MHSLVVSNLHWETKGSRFKSAGSYEQKWSLCSNYHAHVLWHVSSGSEELKKCPSLSSAVLQLLNGHERKTQIEKNTNFQGNKIPKENATYKCLSLIMLGSVTRVSKKYYPQTLLEECKHKIKKNKMENLINDDLDLSSSDNESDNESDGSDSECDE